MLRNESSLLREAAAGAFGHVSDPFVLQSLAVVDESQVNISLIEDLLQVCRAA